jgi:hypothetical protein
VDLGIFAIGGSYSNKHLGILNLRIWRFLIEQAFLNFGIWGFLIEQALRTTSILIFNSNKHAYWQRWLLLLLSRAASPCAGGVALKTASAGSDEGRWRQRRGATARGVRQQACVL